MWWGACKHDQDGAARHTDTQSSSDKIPVARELAGDSQALIYTTKKKCGRDKVCEYPATFTYMFTAECDKHLGQSSHHNDKYK